jgi:hypothetical protein
MFGILASYLEGLAAGSRERNDPSARIIIISSERSKLVSICKARPNELENGEQSSTAFLEMHLIRRVYFRLHDFLPVPTFRTYRSHIYPR